MVKIFCLFIVVCLLWVEGVSQNQEKNRRMALPVSLRFNEILKPEVERLEPSEKLLSLNHRQVKMIGFMARLEDSPLGAFYLCSRPVKCDESGGGIGDLPLDAVLVVVPSMHGRKVPFSPRLLTVTGELEIGADDQNVELSAPILLILPSRQIQQATGKPNINNQFNNRRKSR